MFSLPQTPEEEKKNDEFLVSEQLALANLSKEKGWKIIEEMIQDIIKEIDNNTKGIGLSSTNFEEIGKWTVISSVAKGYIERILAKVHDARRETERTANGE